ncbi:YrbL family protein [Marinobacter sp. JSM 1782161]|uniref:YrbL family protein n=1 Tax=Marinobacter sp. JSM 1782161 TaxID=2685906 RepID=UPI0014023B3D|nr:YrbL family protein [Marinobacter sp. JSM 1782161]
MIDLSQLAPFAAGFNRYCYVHPDDPRRCLKVLRPENIDARYARQAWYKKLLGKQRINDNRQEWLAYQQPALKHAGDEAWRHLPKLYPSVVTSLGEANVSDLILEADGRPGQTLEQYLKERGQTAAIDGAVARFCDWLRETGVLTRNLLPHNLVVVTRDDQPELFLVDGLGAPSVPNALARLPAYRDRYIDRKITRFHQRIAWEAGGRSGSWEDASRIRRSP